MIIFFIGLSFIFLGFVLFCYSLYLKIAEKRTKTTKYERFCLSIDRYMSEILKQNSTKTVTNSEKNIKKTEKKQKINIFDLRNSLN